MGVAGGVSSTKFPRRGLEKSHSSQPSSREFRIREGGRQRWEGAGARPGPDSPRSATCKQAPAGLGTGDPGLRLRAAHLGGPYLFIGRSSPFLDSAGSHTHPLPRSPRPDTALPAAPRVPSPGRSPRPPKFLPTRPPAATPSLPAARRSTLETHQTHLGMAENRTQSGRFKNRPPEQKSKRALQTPSTGRPGPRAAAGGVRGGGTHLGQGMGEVSAAEQQQASPGPHRVPRCWRLGEEARPRGGRSSRAPVAAKFSTIPQGARPGAGSRRSAPGASKRVQRGRQRQRGGGAGSARSPRPPRGEPPGPPGRGWGRKGRRAGAGPLPWCVPGASCRRARSPAPAHERPGR